MPRETNIQIRRGTAADWSSVNPTLAQGELAMESDTRKVKVGDGSTAWNSLQYVRFDGGDIGGGGATTTAAPTTTTTAAPTTTTTAAPTTTTTAAPTTTTTAAPSGFIWSGFSGETDYFGNPFPPVTFTVAGTADGVNYYTGSTSAQTGPESYMISTMDYYLFRTTNDPQYFPEGGGDWQIRRDNMVNFGGPASYIFWTGTPSSTPPLSGWSNGSLQSS